MPDEFAVTGITVSDVPVIPPVGPIRHLKVVRYMVGGHGPFQDDYPVEEFTPDKARARIEKRVQELRTLVGFYSPPR